MENVWGRVSHLFQKPIICNILDQILNENSHGNLLVQCSGKEKSTVYQSVGNILRGVTLIIQPTLALCADQSSKIEYAKVTDYAIVGIECDSIKSAQCFELLENTLLDLESTTTTNIFLCVP